MCCSLFLIYITDSSKAGQHISSKTQKEKKKLGEVFGFYNMLVPEEEAVASVNIILAAECPLWLWDKGMGLPKLVDYVLVQSTFYPIFKISPYLLTTLSYITWIITYTSSFSHYRIGHSFKEKKVSFWQSHASPSAERRRRDSSQRNATALAVTLLLLPTTERRRHRWLTGRL